MNLKKSCSLMFALYVVAAIAVGWVVYRRMPRLGAAVGGGVVGGGIVWFGLAYLAGVRTKIAEAMRLRRTLAGGPLADDETVAIVGAIEAVGAALTSPFTGQPCVAYKYEVRSGDAVLYDGFALAPSAIDTQHGKIGILALPALQVRPRVIPSDEAQPNFSGYIGRTKFDEKPRDLLHAFHDRDGHVRVDTRYTHGDVPLGRATFTEWSVAPGDHVFVAGHYSAARSALVPQPGMPMSLAIRDAAGGVAGRSVVGAFGNLIGAAIFLGIAAAVLLGFYAFVPLGASEQMSPTLTPTWREIHLERFLDRRVRGRLRAAGLLDSGIVSAILNRDAARGRVAANGRDVAVSRATATRIGDMTVIRIDDDVVALTIGRHDHRPLRLRFGNDDVDASTLGRDLDLEITASSDKEVGGRFTYFRDDAPQPACRVTFRASLGGQVFTPLPDDRTQPLYAAE